MKIVFLIGPSSAGKSTLCDALVSEHGWLTHGDDRVMQMIGEEQKAVLQERLLSHGLFGKLSQYMGEDAVIRLAETGLLEFEYGSISIKHQFRSPDFPNLKRVLSDAGFSNQELEKLTTLLSEVSTVFRNLPIPNPTDKMLDDIFNFPADSSVILDKVPHLHGDAKTMLDEFKGKLIEKALEEDIEIEFAIVIAFCPPNTLSARIKRRNEDATISGNLTNKREGTFPFFQLSQLITAAEASAEVDSARALSRMQLFMIALQHLPPHIGQGEQMKAKAIFKAGAHEYFALMQKFSLGEASNVTVEPRKDLDAHAIIDLSQQVTPSELAIELIDKTMDAPVVGNGTSLRP